MSDDKILYGSLMMIEKWDRVDCREEHLLLFLKTFIESLTDKGWITVDSIDPIWYYCFLTVITIGSKD